MPANFRRARFRRPRKTRTELLLYYPGAFLSTHSYTRGAFFPRFLSLLLANSSPPWYNGTVMETHIRGEAALPSRCALCPVACGANRAAGETAPAAPPLRKSQNIIFTPSRNPAFLSEREAAPSFSAAATCAAPSARITRSPARNGAKKSPRPHSRTFFGNWRTRARTISPS